MTLEATLSDEESRTNIQRIGGCPYTSISIVSRIETTEIDHMGLGRWTVVHLKDTKLKQMIIVTIYRVATETDGEDTVYSYQYRLMCLQEKYTPDPQQQIIGSINELISTWLSQGR